MYEIYALLDPKDSKIRYIGYTSEPKNRLNNHIRACLKSREKNCHRCKWLNSLDERPLYKTLIRTNSLEEIKQLEIDYIKYYKSLFKLTNNTIGGDGTKGLKWSEESKSKIKDTRRGIRQDRRYEVRAVNKLTGEHKTFEDKSEAAKYIGCAESSIIDVSIGRRNSVNNWCLKLIKKGAQKL